MNEGTACIVGHGCALPGALDAASFWRILMAGESRIRPVPADRWDGSLYLAADGENGDRPRSVSGGFVEEALLARAGRDLGLAPGRTNRLQTMALWAAAQALSGLRESGGRRPRVAVVLGCMDVDEEAPVLRFAAEDLPSLVAHARSLLPGLGEEEVARIEARFRPPRPGPVARQEALLTTSVFALLRERLGIDGECLLVDAACASSLAALDLAQRMLAAGEADLVLAGGVESNLGPDTFALFDRLGVLARRRSLPLDARSEGLAQGEGAVVFALERLADASRAGRRIHAVLRGSGASSDGRAASLFAPTEEGQLRAYAEAWEGLDPEQLVFVEAHATGTPTGDATEMRSLARFFGPRPLPVGAVKWAVGHTKGAAGAVGVLKCVLALEHGVAPPSPYFRSPVVDGITGPFVNREPVLLPPGRRPRILAASAFGFGGINHHVVLEEDTPARGSAVSASAKVVRPECELMLVGEAVVARESVREEPRLDELRIAPLARPAIDAVQLAALLAADRALAAARIDLGSIDRRKVAVIAASSLGLDAAYDLALRVRHHELRAALPDLDETSLAQLLTHRDRHPKLSEETGPGVLNNVVAGRVANLLDLAGATFNVDADLASPDAALRAAGLLLRERDGLVIVLSAREEVDGERFRVERREVTGRVFATRSFAREHGLRPSAVVEGARLRPYAGPDFSRTCVLFAPQGTAFPGMLAEAVASLEPLRRRLEAADDLARRERLAPPSSFITAPDRIPAAELHLIRNLALLAVEVGLFDHVLDRGVVPHVLTGLSFGEFGALAAARVVAYEDMLEVVLARDRLSPPPNQLGSLIAIEGGPERAAAVLDPADFSVSNRNGPRQTVIAVRRGLEQKVLAALGRAGVRCKLLEGVPQPYHSPRLAPASRGLEDWLFRRGLEVAPARFPVFSSVEKTLLEAGRALPAERVIRLLARQMVEPVDFGLQVEAAAALGSFAFLELSPRPMLGTLVADILGSREHFVRPLPLDLGAATGRTRAVRSAAPARPADGRMQRLFDLLRRAVARVTGFEVESISLEDRFQEDLALDSIKKAAVVFTVLEEAGGAGAAAAYDSSRVLTVADAVDVLAEPSAPVEEVERPVEFQRWVEREELQELPRQDDADEGRRPLVLVPLESLLGDPISGGERTALPPEGDLVFVAKGRAPKVPDMERDLTRLVEVFRVFQDPPALLGKEKERELFLVTAEASHPHQISLAAFFKSLRKELPGLFFRHLHFEELPDDEAVLRIAAAERASGSDIDVRYALGQRRVVRLVEARSGAAGAVGDVPALVDGAVVLALGGAKGITHALLREMGKAAKLRLVVGGRSPRAEVAAALAELEQRGATVDYVELDARDAGEVRRLFERALADHGRIDLVLNGVGIERSEPLARRGRASMLEELSTKVLAAAHVQAEADRLSARRVVHFSSVVARWGNPGQAVYACANQVVNRLARSAALAIEWPPWDGVGMTASPGVKERLRAAGLARLGAERAWELLADALARPHAGTETFVDRGDLLLYGLPLRDHRAARPLVGEPAPPDGFVRRLSLASDAWLEDHRIDGVAYLPAASALAMALCLGRAGLAEGARANGEANGSPVVRDFRMKHALPVGESAVALNLRLGARGARVVGISGRTKVEHFSCRVEEEEAEEAASRSARAASRMQTNASGEGEEIDVETLYAPGLLFHGPRLQVLHRVQVDGGGTLRAWVEEARRRPLLGLEPWDRLVHWLDAAFQALALRSMLMQPVLAVPVEVGCLRLEELPPPDGSVVLEASGASDGDRLVGDVVVRSDSGEVRLVLEGVVLQRLR